MKTNIAIAAQVTLALAIAYLAYAIHSASTSFNQAVERYPAIFADIVTLTDSLEIDQWLALAQTFEKISPDIISISKDLQVTASEINHTVASIDQKIPTILTEITAFRTEAIPSISHSVTTIDQHLLPKALAELALYRQQVIPSLQKESQAYRLEVIPPLLAESEQLRLELPVMIADVNDIVDKSENLAEDAAQGAVKGVILSPLHLFQDAQQGLNDKLQLPQKE